MPAERHDEIAETLEQFLELDTFERKRVLGTRTNLPRGRVRINTSVPNSPKIICYRINRGVPPAANLVRRRIKHSSGSSCQSENPHPQPSPKGEREFLLAGAEG